jgi:hypothetical protein
VNMALAKVLVNKLMVTFTADEFGIRDGTLPGPQVPVHSGWFRKKLVVSIGIGVARACPAMVKAADTAANEIRFR